MGETGAVELGWAVDEEPDGIIMLDDEEGGMEALIAMEVLATDMLEDTEASEVYPGLPGPMG